MNQEMKTFLKTYAWLLLVVGVALWVVHGFSMEGWVVFVIFLVAFPTFYLVYKRLGIFRKFDQFRKKKALHKADDIRDLYAQARLHIAVANYAKAEGLYRQALEAQEEDFGPEHPEVATVCENMAELYRQIGKEDEAERLEERARKIRSKR